MNLFITTVHLHGRVTDPALVKIGLAKMVAGGGCDTSQCPSINSLFPARRRSPRVPAAAYIKYASPQTLVWPCPAKKIHIYELDTYRRLEKFADGLVTRRGVNGFFIRR